MPTYEILCKSCKATVLGSYTSEKVLSEGQLRAFRSAGVCGTCQPVAIAPRREAQSRRHRERTSAARDALKALSKEERQALRVERKAKQALITMPALRMKEEAPEPVKEEVPAPAEVTPPTSKKKAKK